MAEGDGQIGAAIEGEEQQQQGRLKSFVTDPKNLATALVLGAALAAPRTGGRNPLAHALRGGVGALTFRGGLDQGIQRTRQEEEAQAAQIEQGERRIGVAEQQIESGEQQSRQDRVQRSVESTSRDLSSELDRQNALEIAKIRGAAVQQNSQTLLQRALLEAQKGYNDAYAQWIGFGQQGTAPDYGTYLTAAMQSAALLGELGEGQLDFQPTPEPVPTPEESTVPGVVNVEGARQPRPSVAERRAARIAGVDFEDPAAIDTFVETTNKQVADNVDKMSNEELVATWKRFSAVLSPELKQKIRVRLRQTSEGVGQRLGTDLALSLGLKGLVGEPEVGSSAPQREGIEPPISVGGRNF